MKVTKKAINNVLFNETLVWNEESFEANLSALFSTVKTALQVKLQDALEFAISHASHRNEDGSIRGDFRYCAMIVTVARDTYGNGMRVNLLEKYIVDSFNGAIMYRKETAKQPSAFIKNKKAGLPINHTPQSRKWFEKADKKAEHKLLDPQRMLKSQLDKIDKELEIDGLEESYIDKLTIARDAINDTLNVLASIIAREIDF